VPQRILQRRIGGKTVASVRRLSRILAAVLITLALPGQAVAQNESSLR
jgi:hypothetical protein